MEIIENEVKVWDQIWEGFGEANFRTIEENLINSKKSELWIHFTKIVNEKFGGWKKVNSVELGSGMGWYSFVAASEGAKVTLLDYSESALILAKKRFDAFSFEGDFICGNAFDIILENNNKFNLSWSFGTAEHFRNDLRQKFFQLHFDFLDSNGITIISCPHKYAINYRIWMYYANKYNEWDFGLEIPFSKKEYLARLKLTGNNLIEIKYDRGRPCLNKMQNILKENSKMRYYAFYPIVYFLKKVKINLFNMRSIILIAQKK
jgi:SAM-dependent methyltransferase